jgi:hypothetical protein
MLPFLGEGWGQLLVKKSEHCAPKALRLASKKVARSAKNNEEGGMGLPLRWPPVAFSLSILFMPGILEAR